tara:strand:- start:242 stop:349 length:108 start_codon:yes stop_codon:yes gene_type:complete
MMKPSFSPSQQLERKAGVGFAVEQQFLEILGNKRS